MVPRIGITCCLDEKTGRFTLNKLYCKAVETNYGAPLILPYTSLERVIHFYCENLDGLLLSGGGDIDPKYFDEEPCGTGVVDPDRDLFEIMITKKFLEYNKPVFAVCRGIQVLNIAAGGNIYQDIELFKDRCIDHMQQAPGRFSSHYVYVSQGSKLGRMCKKYRLRVNSFHHQAVKDLASGFKVSAKAADGVIEAIESEKHYFVIGIQWHPEHMFENDITTGVLFKKFIESCERD